MGYAETTRENLRLIVEAYSKAAGKPGAPLSLKNVSRRFYGAHGFLEAFFSGRQSVSVDKLDEMIRAMRREWPAGADWPDWKPVVFKPLKRRPRENFPVENAAAG